MTKKIKAKVLIDIETDFDDNESDMETVRYCLEQDLQDSWTINSVKFKEFHMKEEDYMKKFKGNRKLNKIIDIAKSKGYWVNTAGFDNKGNDYIYLTNETRRIAYNTFNGGFMIYDNEGKCIANHKSDELDNEDWYLEILKMFYIPA